MDGWTGGRVNESRGDGWAGSGWMQRWMDEWMDDWMSQL